MLFPLPIHHSPFLPSHPSRVQLMYHHLRKVFPELGRYPLATHSQSTDFTFITFIVMLICMYLLSEETVWVFLLTFVFLSPSTVASDEKAQEIFDEPVNEWMNELTRSHWVDLQLRHHWSPLFLSVNNKVGLVLNSDTEQVHLSLFSWEILLDYNSKLLVIGGNQWEYTKWQTNCDKVVSWILISSNHHNSSIGLDAFIIYFL